MHLRRCYEMQEGIGTVCIPSRATEQSWHSCRPASPASLASHAAAAARARVPCGITAGTPRPCAAGWAGEGTRAHGLVCSVHVDEGSAALGPGRGATVGVPGRGARRGAAGGAALGGALGGARGVVGGSGVAVLLGDALQVILQRRGG